MKFLTEALCRDPDFSALLKNIQKSRKPFVCTGLSLIHKALALSAIYEKTGQKITVITEDEASANELANDVRSLGLRAVNFPLRDYCLGALSGYSKEYEQKRTDTLSIILDGAFDLLTISLDAALQYTVPPEKLVSSRFSLSVGEEISTADLTEKLLNAGYVRSELCEGKGQFSLRGGIFDVFPITFESPCRIEFWGDEIDSLSFYDIETQRRTENTEQVDITPACEVFYNSFELLSELKNYKKTAKN